MQVERKVRTLDALVYAHFLVIDVVGASDPVLPVKRQKKRIETLNRLIASSGIFKSAKRDVIFLHTGDGAILGFRKNPELPFKLAIELHRKMNAYNKGRFTEETLGTRVGMHHGPVYVVKDALGKKNYWGPGIILARRVMDICDDGHILLTPMIAEMLRELSDEYKKMIHPVHDYIIKHGIRMLLYSVYGEGIGNPDMPKKSLSQISKIRKHLEERKLVMRYSKTDVSLTITDPKTMLAHHKRTHIIDNISKGPIKTVLLGVATDVPKKFTDLNIKTLDESGKELKIISINLDKPYQKEFTIAFRRPIYKGKKNTGYVLEYDVEEPERYFENFFSVDCAKYTMSLTYPSDAGFKPVVYDVNVEEETKKRSKVQPAIKEVENGFVRASWGASNLMEGQAVRLEW